MKTQIINYGTADENYILPGTYDEHTVDTCQGVYGKAEMVRFVHVVTDHFLTPKQKYFYFQCVVYGKKVENVAEQEGLDASTVYKHLKLAKQKIASVKDLMRIAGGKKGAIVILQQIINGFGDRTRTIAIDFYVNGMTKIQIANKYKTGISPISGILDAVKGEAIYKGLTADDLKFIRDYYKKERE